MWVFTSLVTYGNKLPSPSTPHCGSKPRDVWWKFIRLCPLIPTWLLSLLGWGRWTLITNSWVSPLAGSASTGLPISRSLSYPSLMVPLEQRLLRMSERSRGCQGWRGGCGLQTACQCCTRTMDSATWLDIPQPFTGVAWQLRGPEEAEHQQLGREKLWGALLWEIYRTQGYSHLCWARSLFLTASCHSASAYATKMVK